MRCHCEIVKKTMCQLHGGLYQKGFQPISPKKASYFLSLLVLEDVPHRYGACRIVKYSGRTFYINRVDKHQKTDQKQGNSTGTKIYMA